MAQWRLEKVEQAHVQVLLLSVIAFGALGIHNATSQGTDATMALRITLSLNQVAYHLESVLFSFVATPFVCQVGVRKLTLAAALIASLQGVNEILLFGLFPGHTALLLLSGTASAASNSLLWIAIYAVVLGYATRAERARYIATMWTFIHVGATVNAAVNVVPTRWVRLAALLCLQLVAGAVAVYSCLLLTEPALVVKADGSYARTYKLCVISSVSAELCSVFRAAMEVGALLMLPAAFAGVWTRPLEISFLVGTLTPTTAVGNAAMTLYFSVQALSAWLLPLVLKRELSLKPLYVCVAALGLALQVAVAALAESEARAPAPKLGWVLGLLALLALYDCLSSTLLLWVAGALAEGHTRKCVRTGSLLQGVQSLGGVVAWAALEQRPTTTFRLHSAVAILLLLLAFPCGCLATEIVQWRDAQRNGHAATAAALRDDASSSGASTNPSFFSLYVPK